MVLACSPCMKRGSGGLRFLQTPHEVAKANLAEAGQNCILVTAERISGNTFLALEQQCENLHSPKAGSGDGQEKTFLELKQN